MLRQDPASFCLFSSFPLYNDNYSTQFNWCAWESNPGPQDARHRRVHRAMVDPTLKIFNKCLRASAKLSNVYVVVVVDVVTNESTLLYVTLMTTCRSSICRLSSLKAPIYFVSNYWHGCIVIVSQWFQVSFVLEQSREQHSLITSFSRWLGHHKMSFYYLSAHH